MSVASYLADTSAVQRILRRAEEIPHWDEPISAGMVAICPAIELEFLYSARSKQDRRVKEQLLRETFTWVVMPERVFERAAKTQAELTRRGLHRSAGTVDLLVAAAAELHGLTLLHYDHDFVQISEVTGQPADWIAPPGSVP